MNENVLKDFLTRTKGEFYIGVVGSVRSGKSTFIKKFVETKILPSIQDEFLRNKIIDELPQSSSGKQIMTVEPKFIPSNSITITVENNLEMSVRLVDSVGYIIPNCKGFETETGPRMVKTPWFLEPIPFKEAAELGTQKVITNHSTIGILMTCDGSFGDFTRNDYMAVEEVLVNQLNDLKKPYVIVLNSATPNEEKTIKIKEELEVKYNVSCVICNVNELSGYDIDNILKEGLKEFSIEELEINMPSWINTLDETNKFKKDINDLIINSTQSYNKIKDVNQIRDCLKNCEYFKDVNLVNVDPSIGKAQLDIDLIDELYENVIDELIDFDLENKEDFIKLLQEYQLMKKEFSGIREGLEMAKKTGYGVSLPCTDDMTLDKPEVIKQNGRYGVKLKAIAPSIHMIKVDVSSTFEPIIGSEEQSKSLIESLENEEGIWDSNIFGRKLSEVVNDGIKAKIYNMNQKCQEKFRETLEKVINTGNGGVIAIIL